MTSIAIIGTSHIAEQSINEITKSIRESKPEVVAVELDAGRLHALMHEQKRLQLSDILKLGVFGWLFAWLGSWLQRELGKRVGIMPGSDMKIAVEEAKKIKAKIFLIDRPLQVTLRRLAMSMTRWEKVRLFGHILFGWIFPSNRKLLKQIQLDKVPSKALINEMIADIKKKFPGMHRALIEERNQFMARQLSLIQKHYPEAKILAVVGAGHVDGLKEMLIKIQ